jgi:transcriptional regulator with XRE-family HTH domain
MTRLEELRLNAGLSTDALGEKAGVSGMTVRRIEAHRVHPQTSTLKALADALETTVSDLLAPVAERSAA